MRFGLVLGTALLACVLVPLSAAAAPAPAPLAQAAEPDKAEPVPVKVHDVVVFSLEHALGGKSAAQRARAANEALLAAIDHEQEGTVRVQRRGELAAVYAGKTLIVELSTEDAGGAGRLDAHASQIAARVRGVIADERERSAIAGTVGSISLVVFFGLLALWAARKLGELADQARLLIERHPERIGGIRLQSFEVVGPAALRSGLQVLLVAGRVVVVLGIAYVWLVFSLSLFDATRPYTQRLTGFVLTPLSELAGRLLASLPLLLVAFVSGVAIYIVLRFSRLFFASVARGDTKLRGLPADLAQPTGVLLSAALVLAALVFAGPVITGDPEGALARSGTAVLITLGLASTPLLASGMLGVVFVFGRRVRIGQWVRMATHTGQVRELTLLELRLQLLDGSDLRVPYLACLVGPLQVLGERPRASVEISVSPSAPLDRASAVLLTAARAFGAGASVELVAIDADGGLYRVQSALGPEQRESELRLALATALREQGIALGSARASSGTRER